MKSGTGWRIVTALIDAFEAVPLTAWVALAVTVIWLLGHHPMPGDS